MRKLLALLVLIPSLAFGQAGSPTLWEQAAYGDIPGVTYVRLSGWNPAITTTFEPIWGESAAYTPLAAAMSSPYCASSNETADDATGTGVNTLTVKGVTTAYVPFTETVTMHATDGRTSVALATADVLFINSIEVATTGSGKVNAGIIQCGTGANTAGDPAVVHQYMGVSSATAIPASGAGYGNKSESFMYAVPAGYNLMCRNIQCGSVFATAASGHECVIDGYANLTGIFKRYFIQMQHNTGSNPSLSPGLVVIPEKTIVIGKMAGVTGSDVGPASMSADCLLIESTWKTGGQDIL
jgi:hypothetical protein